MRPPVNSPAITAAQALEQHGLTWERLEKIARKALHDRMHASRITLDPDRYQEALDHYIDVGARWAITYNPTLADRVSFPTSCYRRMYPRLTDYLRQRHGDARRGTPLTETPVDRMPDRQRLDPETFNQAVEAISASLPTRCLWTLEHIARPMAENSVTLATAAATAGVTIDYATDLLEELGWRLGHRPRPAEPIDNSLLVIAA